MENLNLRDYIDMFRRRKLEFFMAALAFFLLCVAFAYLWPPKYRSEATIQIDQPDIPQSMLAPAGSDPASMIQAFADQQIEQIHEKMTAESNLVDIITKFDLYADDRRDTPMNRIVLNMRKAIKLELVSADLANPSSVQRLNPSQLAAIAFTISFDYKTPLIAQQVANELVTRFVDEDMKVRRGQAKETSAFLADQIATLETSMAEQEKKISDFKAQHAGGMPEDLPFNMQMAAQSSQTIEQLDQQKLTLQQNLGNLQSQLASIEPYTRVVDDGQVLTTPAIQLKALQAKYSTMSGQYGPEHPDVVKLRHQIEALKAEVGPSAGDDNDNIEARIADLRTNLSAAEKTYGPNHPDVVALRKQLKSLEATRGSTVKRPPVDPMNVKDADNPAYLMIRSQIDAVQGQIKGMEAQQDAVRRQHDIYQQRLLETASVEREFSALSRDSESAQLRFRELKEKKMSADMNETMEQGRKATRLDVIDAPDLPDRAHFPPRLIVLAAGFVFSFFAGFGGVGLAENLSRSVHGSRHLSDLTGVEPLIALPHIYTRREIWRIRLARLEIATAVVSVGLGTVWLVDQYLMPIDVLWSVVSRKFGVS